MDNRYVQLKKYLENRISKLIGIQNEQQKLIETKEEIVEVKRILIEEFNILREDDNETIEYLCNMLNVSPFDILTLIISYPHFEDELKNEPQVLNSKKQYTEFITKLENMINTLDLKIHNQGRYDRYAYELEIYQKYLTLFNENGIVKAIEIEGFEGLLNFIKDAPLDLTSDELLSLIVDFYKYNHDYLERRNQSEITIMQAVVSRNAREVFREIEQVITSPVVLEEEQLPLQVSVELNEEENQKLEKMKLLIEQLKNNYRGLTVDISGLVDNSEFSLNNRVSLYDSALTKEEKWNMILQDLTIYLIPSLTSDKENIFKIFDYIFELYENDFLIEQTNERTIELRTLSKDELRIIKEAKEVLNNFGYELEEYEAYSQDDKNRIDSYYALMLTNDFKSLEVVDSRFSLTYVNFIQKLKKLKANLISFDDYITNQEQYRLEIDDKELDDEINVLLSTIKTLSEEVNSLGEKCRAIDTSDEYTEDIDEELEMMDGALNLLIFLPNSNIHRDSYFDQDKEVAVKKYKKDFKDIKTGFSSLMFCDINREKANGKGEFRHVTTNKGTKQKYPKYIKKKLKPLRYRENNCRITFSRISLTQNNRKTLISELGLDNEKVNIILVYDYGIVYGNKELYAESLNRMKDEKEQIERIMGVFGNDFNHQTQMIAVNLVQNGFACVEEINKTFEMDGR